MLSGLRLSVGWGRTHSAAIRTDFEIFCSVEGSVSALSGVVLVRLALCDVALGGVVDELIFRFLDDSFETGDSEIAVL